jgi:DHA2 family multidrug resistance protein
MAFCLGYALFFANNLLLPVWLQQQLAYTATWAGLVSAPSGLVAVVLTPFLARFGAKVDARWLATLAFRRLRLSYFMRAGYTT